MKLTNGFDAERNAFVILFQVSFLDKYLKNFRGLMKDDNLPKNITVKRVDKNEVEISFPMFKGAEIRDAKNGVIGEIAIPEEFKKQMDKFYDTINVFINVGIRKELMKYEFIPLQGYDVNELFKDLQNAFENKRGFLLIKNYEEYLVSQKNRTYEFTQYVIDHGSLEWADFISDVLGKDTSTEAKRKKALEELNLKYFSRLEKFNWI